MIAAAQARQSLEHLGLTEAVAVLESRLEVAAQKQLPYAKFLADLLSCETTVRRKRYLRTRTRLAHLRFSGRSTTSTSASSRRSINARCASGATNVDEDERQ